MKSYDKYKDKEEEFFYEETGMNKNALRQDHELYHDEDNIVHDMIHIKRIEVGKSEDWNLINGKNIILSIRGRQLNSKEREFMRKPDGIMCVMLAYKKGIRTASGLKSEIKRAAK